MPEEGQKQGRPLWLAPLAILGIVVLVLLGLWYWLPDIAALRQHGVEAGKELGGEALRGNSGQAAEEIGSDKRGEDASVDEARAVEIVCSLPEVKVLMRYLPEKSNGESRAVAFIDGRREIGIGRRLPPENGWVVYVGEDHTTHRVCWNRFFVRARDGMVGVWEPADDTYFPLEDWPRHDLYPRHLMKSEAQEAEAE